MRCRDPRALRLAHRETTKCAQMIGVSWGNTGISLGVSLAGWRIMHHQTTGFGVTC
jgi:hypothetical protein